MSTRVTAMANERRSRWIPWAFVAFFGVVLAANATMIVVAIDTWPGLQTRQAYQRGLAYDDALAAAEAQAALGWDVDFAFEQKGARAGVLTLDLADRFGERLDHAAVQAAFVRPTHDGYDQVVEVPHHYGSRYLQDVVLPLAGQWEVRLHIVAPAGEYRFSERIYLRP